ncbi:MAG TPA: Lrp/AsnC family transcriptional regulator [Microbacteriaceae bacterium]
MSTSLSADVLDQVNRQILAELVDNPRISMSALGRRIGMSAPAVSERVQRLEQTRVITGYTVTLDPDALGYAVTAFVRVKPTPGQIGKIIQVVATVPEISECHRITGEDCFLMKVHATTIRDLERILDQINLYGQTVTSIVQSSPVPPRQLPIAR